MRMIIFTLIMLICLGSKAGFADDQRDLAAMSVRLFHEVCMGSVMNPDRVAELLSQFQQLPEDKADTFRASMESSADAPVWAFNFTKGNFVAVIDLAKNKCDLVSDKQLKFSDVENEFSQAAKGFDALEGMSLTPIETDKSSLMSSIRFSYIVEKAKVQFDVFASVKNGDVGAGQMGSIYTMFVRPLEVQN